ncbi:MAG: type II toxin-antitoxin system VapC family toxin [Nitrospirota bacterium]
MKETVLDATALLALLQEEPGAETVAEAIPQSSISAINLAEVVGKLVDAGMPEEAVRTALAGLGIEVIPFDEDLAYRTGLLRPLTRPYGLSLGDRACLALGQRLGRPVLTADRVWASLKVGVKVRVIR